MSEFIAAHLIITVLSAVIGSTKGLFLRGIILGGAFNIIGIFVILLAQGDREQCVCGCWMKKSFQYCKNCGEVRIL